MTHYWYITICLAIGLLLGNRWFPKVLIFMIGFFFGMFYLFPILTEYDFVHSWIQNNPNLGFSVSVGFGLITAFVGCALFQILFFLGGFIAGGALGLWLWSILAPVVYSHLREDGIHYPWIQWVFAGILGLVVSVLVFVSIEKTISLISIFLGGFTISILSLWVLIQIQPQWFGNYQTEPEPFFHWKPAGIAVFFGVFAIMVSFGWKMGSRKKKAYAS